MNCEADVRPNEQRRKSRPRRTLQTLHALHHLIEQLETRILFSVDVLTYRNDASSTGQNLAETVLTPTNVVTADFGKQFTATLDGQVYAQPLFKSNVNITAGGAQGIHNVVYATTEHDSLYAIDANTGAILWQDSFINPASNITTVPSGDIMSTDLTPEIGITSTPVIDPNTNILYLTAKTKEIRGTDNHYVYKLHAINIANGAEALGGPAVIGDTISNTYPTSTVHDTFVSGPAVNGTGDAAVAGVITFDARIHLQRPAVTLINGTIYLGFASHGDKGPYHGWLLGYSASTLALTAAFNVTPNAVSGDASEGGIWMSGGKISSDTQGNLYVSTGNGAYSNNFDANGFPIDHNYSDSILKLSVDAASNSSNQNGNGWGLKVVDFFTPSNWSTLNAHDIDVGSGGMLILPDSVGSAAHPHLMLVGGKEGRVYLLDRDNLGKFTPIAASPASQHPSDYDKAVQEFQNSVDNSGSIKIYDTPAYFNGKFYIHPGTIKGQAFAIANGAFNTTPQTTSTSYGREGATPAVSANGSGNGIVWDLSPVVSGTIDDLIAYDATNYTTPIYTSNQNSTRDSLVGSVSGATGVKFSVPTPVNGMVYTGTGGTSGSTGLGTIVAYGLLSSYLTSNSSFFGAPSALNSSNLAGGPPTAHLAWTKNSTLETQFRVDRSTDGLNWSTLAYLPNGAATYNDSTIAFGTQYFYHVAAISGANVTPFTECAFFAGSSTNDSYNISLDNPGTSLVLTVNGGAFTVPSTALSSITVFGSSGNDALTIDFSKGNPVPAGGVNYDGGSNITGVDSLSIIGAASADVASVGGSAITFNSSTITLANTESLTISTAGGNDTLTQTSALTGVTNFTFDGGAGNDTLNVDGGTYTFRSDPLATGSALTVNANAPIIFQSAGSGTHINLRQLAALNLGAAATVTLNTAAAHADRLLLTTSALSFAGTTNAWQGKLDLGGNDMIIKGGVLTDIINQLQAGLNLPNNGFWNGSSGIISLAAATDPTHLSTLGVLQNNDGANHPIYGATAPDGPFDTQSPAINDILIKYTYFGDADLTGKIDGTDYGKIDNGFAHSLSTWFNGDFNYDGVIDGSDYSLIDNAFNIQASPLTEVAAPSTTPADNATQPVMRASPAHSLPHMKILPSKPSAALFSATHIPSNSTPPTSSAGDSDPWSRKHHTVISLLNP